MRRMEERPRVTRTGRHVRPRNHAIDSFRAERGRKAQVEPVLKADGVCKRYGRHQVLDSVSFSVSAGRSLAIVGANGCGKSTLLKICVGMLSPDAGSITVRGHLGYCPQSADLGSFLTPDNHFTWFGSGHGLGRARSNQEGANIASSLNWQVVDKQVRYLSGGTAQKLNVTCAILGRPDVILLDEPYQGFDEGSYLDFWDLVESWCDKGAGVVIVTHMLRELHRVHDVLDLSPRAAA